MGSKQYFNATQHPKKDNLISEPSMMATDMDEILEFESRENKVTETAPVKTTFLSDQKLTAQSPSKL